jgi:hypothetical protein
MEIPISETIIAAIAQLIDDSKTSGEYREPTHSDITFYVNRAGLNDCDPKTQGQAIGKAKRLRSILSWSYDNNAQAGSKLIEMLLAKIRAVGGFRKESTNFVGKEAIVNAAHAFRSENFVLSDDGEIHPIVLENLSGRDLTEALKSYAKRAQKGSTDAALLVGTSKDLLEATAAHILVAKMGHYPTHSNFQTLLGQAFISLNLTLPEQKPEEGEAPTKMLERSLFQTACSINKLRNKLGTGHGRPWITDLSIEDAKLATELVGFLSGYLLSKLEK